MDVVIESKLEKSAIMAQLTKLFEVGTATIHPYRTKLNRGIFSGEIHDDQVFEIRQFATDRIGTVARGCVQAGENGSVIRFSISSFPSFIPLALFMTFAGIYVALNLTVFSLIAFLIALAVSLAWKIIQINSRQTLIAFLKTIAQSNAVFQKPIGKRAPTIF